MTATMGPCSTGILAEKNILQILHLYSSIKIFTNAFVGKFHEKMMAFIESRDLERY